jgi:hypothetical protein
MGDEQGWRAAEILAKFTEAEGACQQSGAAGAVLILKFPTLKI